MLYDTLVFQFLTIKTVKSSVNDGKSRSVTVSTDIDILWVHIPSIGLLLLTTLFTVIQQ